MASSVPPVKNSAFTTYVALTSQGSTSVFQPSVTLAAGDVQVSKDGGAFANIDSLPSGVGSNGVLELTLAADEMNADVVTILFHDAAGDEWQDALVTIHTAAQTLDTVDTNVDSVLDDTGTSGVVLADDAITSAKYDESTAYPLASADSGATEVARTGADGDTLETLSDEIATVDSNVDAILLDTGTDGVVLADDAITSAKYDESTAYPLKSADTGATEVARTGADGDTLETLSDEISVIDGIVDAILLDTGTDGVALSTAVKQAIADELLKRGVSNVEDSADAHSLATIILATLESALSGSTWTIKKTDGTTFTTKTVTTDSSADPITEVT